MARPGISASEHVRHVGQVQDIDGMPLDVGVDYDTVSLAIGTHGVRLNATQLEELAQFLVSATWQAAKCEMDLT